MGKAESTNRFGPGIWVTVRDTGEHVKIESWSVIAASYRARSSRSGLLYVTDAELDEIVPHPDEERLGRQWSRCRNTACGAPLTPGLPTCDRCETLKCTCGRCACTVAARARKAKSRSKSVVESS